MLVELIFEFFKRLGYEKGEDIFEYGFGAFNEEHYLLHLKNSGKIEQDLYYELQQDGAELFQIVQSVNEDDYDECLKVFAEYLVNFYGVQTILQVMMDAIE